MDFNAIPYILRIARALEIPIGSIEKRDAVVSNY